jgi:hypothetical protein
VLPSIGKGVNYFKIFEANFYGAAIYREKFELFQNFRDNFYGAAIYREKFELFHNFREKFLPCCHLSGKI